MTCEARCVKDIHKSMIGLKYSIHTSNKMVKATLDIIIAINETADMNCKK